MQVLGFIFWFLICPYLTGKLLCFGREDEIRKNILFRYIIGFFGSIAVFTFLCVPMTLLGSFFHTLKWTYIGIMLLIMILSTILCLKNRNKILCSGTPFRSVFQQKSSLFWFVALLIFTLYQLIRMCTKGGLNIDDSVYIPIANDILYSDRLFMINFSTGGFNSTVWEIGPKYVGSAWFAMIAFWCDRLHVHTLFLWKTLFPCFYLIFYYLILWMISKAFFQDKYTNRFAFVFLNALFMDNKLEKLSLGISWGKIVVKFGCVILLIYILYMLYQKEKIEWRDTLLLLAVTFSGAGMTMMTIMLFSILLGVMSLTESIRRKALKPILQAAIAEIPLITEAIIYLYALVVFRR